MMMLLLERRIYDSSYLLFVVFTIFQILLIQLHDKWFMKYLQVNKNKKRFNIKGSIIYLHRCILSRHEHIALPTEGDFPLLEVVV